MNDWQYHQDGRDSVIGLGTIGCLLLIVLFVILLACAIAFKWYV